MLHGRAAEQAVIDLLIADARARRSGSLVLRGEPGIGKTALLDYAARAALAGEPDATATMVIRSAGLESEVELPFSGLHMLLRPLLDRLAALPLPQQDALHGVFGWRPPTPVDPFLIGLAVLSLLAELAEDRLLLFLVDDAHWLDQASADALVFAVRRLHAERIAVIFAARDTGVGAAFAAPGLPELRLGGLDAAAAALLIEHGGVALPDEVRRRILDEAKGNPLGLIELAVTFRGVCGTATRFGGPALPLTDRLHGTFHGQVRRLPEHTRAVLLVAAAEDSGDLTVVLNAARVFAATVADLEPAERSGLVKIDNNSVEFCHPLVRAAVYQGATLSQRMAAHRALADAVRDAADADRRAWHLAAAATGPDEGVAAELERTAGGAIARGGYSAAAAAYERAVQLTADPAAQAGRLTLAAEAVADIGAFDRARALAAHAAGLTEDPIARARLANVRALADLSQGGLRSAHRLQVEGAGLISDLDTPRATRMLMHATYIAWFLGDAAQMHETADRLETVNRNAPDSLRPLVRLLLCSAAQAMERPGDDLKRLAELVAEARSTRADDPFDLALAAFASLVTGLNSDAHDLLATLVAGARVKGRIGSLPALLTGLAQVLIFDGRLREGMATASEALHLARDTGQQQWAGEANAIRAYLAAIDGDEQRCRRLVDAALAEPAGHFTATAKPWV